MAALTDGGLFVQAPKPFLLFGAIVVTPYAGLIINPKNGVFTWGVRTTSMMYGMIVETFNNPYGGDYYGVPGYALRKGLRVLTLDEEKRKAFTNIPQ